MNKYRAKDTLLIQTTGVEIELDLSIEFSVSRYRAATLTQPEEPRMVEIEEISMFFQDGTPIISPWSIEAAIADSDAFKARLLEEAYEQDMCAAEDAADAKRERQWEDAR